MASRKLKRRTVRIGKGCQAVRLESGWWHVRWYDGSRSPKQKQHALDTDDEALALSRARDRYDRKLAGLYDPWKGSGRALTVAEAVRLYQADRSDRDRPATIRVVSASVLALARSTGPGPNGRWVPAKSRTAPPTGADPEGVGVRDVSADDVRRFVYRRELSRQSQLSYWRRLHAWFEWAADRQLVDENPVAGVQRPATVRAGLKHLSRAEVERLLVTIEHHHGPDGPVPEHVRRRDPHGLWARDAFALLASTGLRRAEAVALTWADVVWPEDSPWGVGYVSVVDDGSTSGRRTKTGRSRRVTMIPSAEVLLRRLQEETRRTNDACELVLKGADGERPVSPHTLSHNFRRYRELARLPDVPLHGLRHSFAVELLLRGASVLQVRDELGHATVQTTERYLELLPAERARATAALFAE